MPALTPEQEMLLPCPCCGERPTLYDMAGWEIHCACGLGLCLLKPDKGPLIAHWNRRAQLEAQEGVSTLPSTPLPDSARKIDEQDKDAAIIAQFESILSIDPTAFLNDKEAVYQVTKSELLMFVAALQQPVQAVPDGRYDELIYAVARKFPGEMRHETALRYIRQAEANANSGGPAAVGAAPGEPGQ